MKLKVTFKCLTPIFIGSGETISYIDIILDNKTSYSSQKSLYRISYKDIPPKLEGEFSKLLEKDEAFRIPPLYKKKIKDYSLKKIPLGDSVDNEIIKKIRESESGKLNNQVLINMLPIRHNKPYIPGSSIKGMLKTPFIKNNLDIFKEDNKNIANDPFKDFLVRDSNNENLKINIGDIIVKNIYNEVSNIPSYYQYILPDSTFESHIIDNMNSKYSFDQAHNFYIDVFNKLKNEVYYKDKELCPIPINNININNNEFLVSIGGFGGIHTKIIKETNEKKKSFRRSVKCNMPIGWCKGKWEKV